jgi:hypothetical protein
MSRIRRLAGLEILEPDGVTADFRFTVGEYQANPASADFLAARAAVACRGFSGETGFWISRRDVDRFLDDIAGLRELTSDSAQLLGGWDDSEERLRLKITRAGLSNGFVARVRIATTGPREDQWNRVETEFVCPLESMLAFELDLGRLLVEEKPGMVVLSGDAQAIT